MANYFSHDSNARSDNKIIALRMKYGWEGYGLYFALIEKLADSPCYKLPQDYNALAYDLRADNAKIRSIVNDFGLFEITEDGNFFYSNSLLKRMQFKDEKSIKARESANKRWEKEKLKKQMQSDGNSDVMRTHSECNANAPQNQCERNANKIKGKENIDFPSEEEKSSFPSNEEKASNAREGKVEVSGNSGNGDFGGLGEQSLAAEIETENGFANLSKNALVGEAGQETETPSTHHERKSGDLTEEKNKAGKSLTSDSKNVSEAKKNAKSSAFQQEKIPYQEIVDLFNSICLDYPKVVKLSNARKNKIRIRVEEMGGFSRAKPIIQKIFEKMQASKFMRGDNKRGWKAYFDWIFENGKNWVKILEGNYDNSNKNSGAHSATDSDAEFMRNIAEGIARANFEKQQRRNGSESL